MKKHKGRLRGIVTEREWKKGHESCSFYRTDEQYPQISLHVEEAALDGSALAYQLCC